jgi:hypothetical protein
LRNPSGDVSIQAIGNQQLLINTYPDDVTTFNEPDGWLFENIHNAFSIGGFINSNYFGTNAQNVANYIETIQQNPSIGDYDTNPFIFTDDVNNIQTTNDMLFIPNPGINKTGLVKWGLIFPTSKMELAVNIQNTLLSLLSQVSVTIDNSGTVFVSQLYTLTNEPNYELHPPSYMYDFNLVMPMPDEGFRVIKNPIISTLIAVNNDGTVAVNDSQYVNVKSIDAVTFNADMRTSLRERALIATDDGCVRLLYLYFKELEQDKTFGNSSMEMKSAIIQEYNVFEALTECAANETVLARKLDIGYLTEMIFFN